MENSDAVISMPFSSPSLTAKVKGVPSIYYDRSGLVRSIESHGIPVLKNEEELKKWFESLV
jgi:polysaccharide biosynthesis PFTS motif protein